MADMTFEKIGNAKFFQKDFWHFYTYQFNCLLTNPLKGCCYKCFEHFFGIYLLIYTVQRKKENKQIGKFDFYYTTKAIDGNLTGKVTVKMDFVVTRLISVVIRINFNRIRKIL